MNRRIKINLSIKLFHDRKPYFLDFDSIQHIQHNRAITSLPFLFVFELCLSWFIHICPNFRFPEKKTAFRSHLPVFQSAKHAQIVTSAALSVCLLQFQLLNAFSSSPLPLTAQSAQYTNESQPFQQTQFTNPAKFTFTRCPF